MVNWLSEFFGGFFLFYGNELYKFWWLVLFLLARKKMLAEVFWMGVILFGFGVIFGIR